MVVFYWIIHQQILSFKPRTFKDPSLACFPELTFDVKPACIFLDQLCCVDKSQSGTKMVDSDTEIRLPVLLEMVD